MSCGASATSRASRACVSSVLTGDVTGDRMGELQSLNVDGLLAKPIDFDSVRLILEKLVAPEDAADRA